MDMYAPITITPRVELFTRKNSDIVNRALNGMITPLENSAHVEESLSSDARLMSDSCSNGFYSETVEKTSHKKKRGASSKKYRALHIEDDEEIRFLVKVFLKNVMEVDSAADGYEAINHSSENKYDLIITDINLGCGIDGIEATREIRNMAYYHNIPIIAATANAESNIRNQCIEVGMDAFLLKPFMKNDLINTIEQVMNKRN